MIKPLTSLRFIFALMVFFHHLIFLISKENELFMKMYKYVFEKGYIGVGFFFILSGYILTHVYKNQIIKNEFNLKRFYIYRIARIYPLHFITLMLSIPLTIGILKKTPFSWTQKFLENILLVQSMIPKRHHYFSFNIVSWSISSEMFFYLLFPFLIILILKLDLRKISILLTIIIVTTVSLMLVIKEDLHHALFYINPLFRLGDFLIGIILYRFSTKFSFSSIGKATILEFTSIILLLLFFSGSSHIPQVFQFSVYYWLPIAFIIVIFSKQKGKISELLSKRVFLLLGEISYGFYLFHLLIIKYSVMINNKYNIIKNEFVLAVIILILSIFVSYLSFHLIEKRFNRKIRRLFESSQ
ncbi:MAG: acyltransferase [Spirochaetaceae bacterium]|nr:acyltransferase [Spirochaetaceae bacterium]